METKTFLEWEHALGVMAHEVTEDLLQKTMTEKEFWATLDRKFLGVHHDDRIKFLQDNGHEVTRQNMMNADLSAKQPETESDVIN